ncbi:hypothetical protein LTS15_009751 [Exophiala xenobiotica]|nr:hypothetical protein LTS15_009751 [Exophiala xenobiotica]
MTANSGTLTATYNNVNSLEWCMDLCTSTNAATPGSCTVAYWASTQQQCQLYPNQLANFPNNLIFNGVHTARLLTPTAANIADATYMHAPTNLYDLGLCGGPSLNYYNLTFLGHIHKDNTVRVNTADIWLITCATSFYYSTGTQTALNTATIAAGQNMAVPTTPDDCMRLCGFYNDANSDNGCRLWHFFNDNSCVLYPSRGGAGNGNTPQYLANLIAAGVFRGSTGTQWPGISYKRSLPPGEGPARYHPRDTLSEAEGVVADFIIPYERKRRT